MPQTLDPGAFVAQRRQELGLTQAELANRLSGGQITSNFIAMIERRRSMVPLRRCAEFATALEVDTLSFVMMVMRAQLAEVAHIIDQAIAGTKVPA